MPARTPDANLDADIAAIVVTYRTGPVLFECLERLKGDPRVGELIVVDNGNPADIVSRLQADNWLRLITGQGNIGFGCACNLGARTAKARYLAFINPDVVLAPGALAALVEAGATARAPWVAGARLVSAEGHEQRGARRDRIDPGSALVAGLGLGRVFRDPNRQDDPVPDRPIEVGAVSGAAMLMRAEDFKALGGFDEGYFLHVEDLDICRRASEAGGAVLFQPTATGVHQRSSSGGSAFKVEAAKAAGFARYFFKFARTPVDFIAAALVTPLIGSALIARGAVRDLARFIRP